MSDEFKNMMQEQACLPRNEMQDYLADRLAGSRLRQVELHLADCELCSDAIDGLKLLTEAETNESLVKIDNRIGRKLKDTPLIIVLVRRSIAIAAVLMVVIIGAFYLNEFMDQKHLEVAQNISGKNEENKKTETNSVTKQDTQTTGSIKFTPPVEDLQESEKMVEQPTLNGNYEGTISMRDLKKKETTTISGDVVMDDVPPVVETESIKNSNEEKYDTKSVTTTTLDLEKDNIDFTVSGSSQQLTSPNNSYSASPTYSPQMQLDEVQIISSGKKNKNGKDKSLSEVYTRLEDQGLSDSVDADIPSELFNLAMQYKSVGEKEKAIEELDKLIKLNNDLKPQAMWEKAILLIELNKKDKAKTVLTDLSNINSSYKQKAIDKIKEL